MSLMKRFLENVADDLGIEINDAREIADDIIAYMDAGNTYQKAIAKWKFIVDHKPEEMSIEEYNNLPF